MNRSVHGGVVAGWLDPYGVCHYVPDTHTDWAARHLKIDWSSKKATDLQLIEGLKIDKKIYDLGWARVIIHPSVDKLYFDTLCTPLKKLTRHQRQHLYDTSVNGYEIKDNKIIPGENPRGNPLTLQFGDTGKTPSLDELLC
jgi:hypothetical protein